MYNGRVIIPASPTPMLPSMNLYPKSISDLFFITELSDVARVLPLFTSIGMTFPSF